MIYDQTECSLTKWSKEQETDLFIAFSSFMTNRSWFLGLILSGVVIYLLFKKKCGFLYFWNSFSEIFRFKPNWGSCSISVMGCGTHTMLGPVILYSWTLAQSLFTCTVNPGLSRGFMRNPMQTNESTSNIIFMNRVDKSQGMKGAKTDTYRGWNWRQTLYFVQWL